MLGTDPLMVKRAYMDIDVDSHEASILKLATKKKRLSEESAQAMGKAVRSGAERVLGRPAGSTRSTLASAPWRFVAAAWLPFIAHVAAWVFFGSYLREGTGPMAVALFVGAILATQLGILLFPKWPHRPGPGDPDQTEGFKTCYIATAEADQLNVEADQTSTGSTCLGRCCSA